jgi:hypothetical protein
MGRIVVTEYISVDGVVEAPSGTSPWAEFDDVGSGRGEHEYQSGDHSPEPRRSTPSRTGAGAARRWCGLESGPPAGGDLPPRGL